MSCYHPLYARLIGTKKNGKKDFVFCKNEQEKKLAEYQGTLIKIGCGNCIGCRLSNASNKADQIMLEAKQYKNNCVVHLTYDDEHLPKNKGVNLETGEIIESETLREKDVQDFLKKLKITYTRGKYNGKEFEKQIGIRTAYCGEYGDQRGRPHYHMILFNFKPHDLMYWEKTDTGYNTYISETISKLWGKGIVKINELTREMAEYIARYVTKKWKGSDAKEKYEQAGKVPEFYHCSNRPGLGYMFFEQKKTTIYETDEIFITSLKGTRSKKPPKYFDKLLEREDQRKLLEVKEKREEHAKARLEMMLKITGWTEEEYLQMQEQARKDKIKALKRKKEAKKIEIDAFGRRKYI